MSGGDASEIVGFPDGVPQLFGELGSAIAVSQALAKSSGHPVVCIVGDGELETPVALASLAHSSVLFVRDRVPWIIAVNANGARMGSQSRFSSTDLHRIFEAFGFEVLKSGLDPETAAQAACHAVSALKRDQPLVWISETPKGWPAPDPFVGVPFRGHHAHKPPKNRLMMERTNNNDVFEFVSSLAGDLVDVDGHVAADVYAAASLAVFDLPSVRKSVRGNICAVFDHDQRWVVPPIEGADKSITTQGTKVFCPDEAASIGLKTSLQAGLVTEVLAEEVCVAWAIGTSEAGTSAIFATYEAFAPLAATQIAQYAKLLGNRQRRRTPAVGILLTSLGWANCPSHQNSDFAGCFLNRSYPFMRLVCPVGAASAHSRLNQLITEFEDGIYALVCSKHLLPDLPDPGSTIVRYTPRGSDQAEATIVAVGDICVAEAVSAMLLAKECGKTVQVFAIVEPTRLDMERTNKPAHLPLLVGPTVAATWCAPQLMRPLLWTVAGRFIPVFGLNERSGATPVETLRLNGLDRMSLVKSLWPNVDWQTVSAPPFDDADDPFPRFEVVELDCEAVPET